MQNLQALQGGQGALAVQHAPYVVVHQVQLSHTAVRVALQTVGGACGDLRGPNGRKGGRKLCELEECIGH